MFSDTYGIDPNYFSTGSGTYDSLAGGSVPMTKTYTAAATNSSNGVNWGGIASGVTSLASTGANIYSTIANASKKPGETNITFLDPNTGKSSIMGDTTRLVPSVNNNLLFIIGGVVLVVVIGFFAFFRKGK